MAKSAYTPEQNRMLREATSQLVAREGSQSKVARMLGLSRSGLSQFLLGQTGAGRAIAEALAKEFHLSVDDLFRAENLSDDDLRRLRDERQFAQRAFTDEELIPELLNVQEANARMQLDLALRYLTRGRAPPEVISMIMSTLRSHFSEELRPMREFVAHMKKNASQTAPPDSENT